MGWIKCDSKVKAKCVFKNKCCGDHEGVYLDGSECDKFAQKVLSEPQTNADRIRGMSDEELAVFLDEVQEEECKTLHEVQQDGTFKFESLRNGWLAWLQQPAEEVHHE